MNLASNVSNVLFAIIVGFLVSKQILKRRLSILFGAILMMFDETFFILYIILLNHFIFFLNFSTGHAITYFSVNNSFILTLFTLNVVVGRILLKIVYN
jgi:hypothetical protein